MVNDEMIPQNEMSAVILEIKTVLDASRRNIARQVNSELLGTYYNIGRIICEYEQTMPERADYGKQTLKELSKVLTTEFGKGFSRSNLQNMRQFYLTYEKCQTLSGKLSWSHYCELLSISDPDKRRFYEKESINANWSARKRTVSQRSMHWAACLTTFLHPGMCYTCPTRNSWSLRLRMSLRSGIKKIRRETEGFLRKCICTSCANIVWEVFDCKSSAAFQIGCGRAFKNPRMKELPDPHAESQIALFVLTNIDPDAHIPHQVVRDGFIESLPDGAYSSVK